MLPAAVSRSSVLFVLSLAGCDYDGCLVDLDMSSSDDDFYSFGSILFAL